MQELDEAQVTVEAGIEGDSRGRSRRRQVTLLAREAWDEACSELGADLPWTTRRANLLVEGIELPREPGARIRVGSVLLEVSFETDPCERMEQAHAGLHAALAPDWRGGVCCSVIEGGTLASGSSVSVLG